MQVLAAIAGGHKVSKFLKICAGMAAWDGYKGIKKPISAGGNGGVDQRFDPQKKLSVGGYGRKDLQGKLQVQAGIAGGHQSVETV